MLLSVARCTVTNNGEAGKLINLQPIASVEITKYKAAAATQNKLYQAALRLVNDVLRSAKLDLPNHAINK